MVWKFIETLSVVIFCCECFVSTLRVTGVWEARNSRFSIIAKFGFQETDELDKEHSRGFIFGNLTAETMQTIDADVSGRAILIVVPQTQISSFFTESIYGLSCDTMLKASYMKNFSAKS
ncbi:hypothetical protein AB6A40_007933 [Gnathostoma spinigerum]|uniref:Uncharacterized protein n=1 Tax=Gnathostoma spinigerum TaxID=75299 RepID=A0ABD6EMN2_9BILA